MSTRGFAAVSAPGARVPILGTLPGQLSLQRGEYYAQPRNTFWRIMGRLFGFSPDLPYTERITNLRKRGIALWDVCATADREGSLDAVIRDPVVNDFIAFFTMYPGIKTVCFNGSKAERLYNRDVLGKLPVQLQDVRCHALPSTSPAHAAIPLSKKFEAWSLLQRVVHLD